MNSSIASRGSSSKSSISSRERGPRPRSPPSMYVSWAVPPPKQPKPLLKLDKKKNKPPHTPSQDAANPGRSLFPSFSKKKGPPPPDVVSKGKAKAMSPSEDMRTRPSPAADSASDCSSLTPPSSRSGGDSPVTSATSVGSFTASLPASPRQAIDHVIINSPRSFSDGAGQAKSSSSQAEATSSKRRAISASHGHQDREEAPSPFSLTFPRMQLKQRTSAEELNHRRSRSVLVKRRSSVLLTSAINSTTSVISENAPASERIGKPISTSNSDTPPHATWSHSSSLRSYPDTKYTDQTDINFADGTPGPSSSRGRHRATSADITEPCLVIHSPTDSSLGGDPSEASEESLNLDSNEAPMTFAGQTKSPQVVKRARAASGSHSDRLHSREESISEEPATPRSAIGASQPLGKLLSEPTELPSQDDHRPGHISAQPTSISVRPGSPFDSLIPPITSIIHKKQDARRQYTLGPGHPNATVRRHGENGWMGEWNRSNMDDVIQSLRTLK